MIITLTAGGIETRIIHEVCNFESFELLEDESGRAMLRQIYQSYANVAVCYGLPFQHPDMAAAEPISATSKLWRKGVQA